MKPQSHFIALALTFWTALASGQGTFIYDQQSSDESYIGEGDAGLGQQPLGQSFTPTLPSVDFVRLILYDQSGGTIVSGTLGVNLRADSITGPILSSASPVTLQGGFGGPVNFFFETPVSVTPGTTYYFQPYRISGDGGWGINQWSYHYPGGSAYYNGVASPSSDLWFREGIVTVPEPGTLGFFSVGALLLGWRLSRHKQRP